MGLKKFYCQLQARKVKTILNHNFILFSEPMIVYKLRGFFCYPLAL